MNGTQLSQVIYIYISYVTTEAYYQTGIFGFTGKKEGGLVLLQKKERAGELQSKELPSGGIHVELVDEGCGLVPFETAKKGELF